MRRENSNKWFSGGPEARALLANTALRARPSRPPLNRGFVCKRAWRGFVLVVVLFVLAIAAVATAAICRISLEKAVQASRAEGELRQRWAVTTCRAVFLPKAEDLLQHSGDSVNEVRRDVILNGQPITLVFGDEQAKANINLLYAQAGLSGAEREVRTIVGLARASLPVELHPIPGVGQNFGSPDASDDDPRAFESFGQVFPHQPPELQLIPAKWLTCWGDGLLNIRRASDQSVRAALTGQIAAAEISRLLDARSKDPKAQIAEFLDTIELPETRREKVENILTDESTCHSLWIISDSGPRKRYDLAVSEGAVVTCFSW